MVLAVLLAPERAPSLTEDWNPFDEAGWWRRAIATARKWLSAEEYSEMPHEPTQQLSVSHPINHSHNNVPIPAAHSHFLISIWRLPLNPVTPVTMLMGFFLTGR